MVKHKGRWLPKAFAEQWDAKKEGFFLVELGENEFRWRLPLSSLLPLTICPTCGEELSGAYKFCPWDGTKLSETTVVGGAAETEPVS